MKKESFEKGKNMRKIFMVFLSGMLLTACCFNKTKVILEEPDFKPGSRVLVYENSGGTAGKLLRGALRKKNIKVLKYASYDGININKKTSKNNGEKEEDTNIQAYTKYDGSPYVVEINGRKRTDISCLAGWDDGCVWEIDVEIADLTTREAVYSVALSGFDEECGYCSGGIFDRAAELISDFWNKQE